MSVLSSSFFYFSVVVSSSLFLLGVFISRRLVMLSGWPHPDACCRSMQSVYSMLNRIVLIIIIFSFISSCCLFSVFFWCCFYYDVPIIHPERMLLAGWCSWWTKKPLHRAAVEVFFVDFTCTTTYLYTSRGGYPSTYLYVHLPTELRE